MSTILLLSGPMASGKTTLANELIAREGFKRLKSSDYLKRIAGHRGQLISRTVLQELGDQLDEATNYRWLIDEIARPQIGADPVHKRWIVDSVRKKRQVSHFRDAFGSDILHVHVWAPDEVLKKRFDQRLASRQHDEGSTSYAQAISHPNEVSARGLKEVADVSIDLSSAELSEAAASVVAALARRK